MNLRLSDDAVRVRLNRDELGALLTRGSVSFGVELPGGLPMRVAVHAREAKGELSIEWNGEELRMDANRDELSGLLARPPAKDLGCYRETTSPSGRKLRLELEIDVFSGSPRRQKKDPVPERPSTS